MKKQLSLKANYLCLTKTLLTTLVVLAHIFILIFLSQNWATQDQALVVEPEIEINISHDIDQVKEQVTTQKLVVQKINNIVHHKPLQNNSKINLTKSNTVQEQTQPALINTNENSNTETLVNNRNAAPATENSSANNSHPSVTEVAKPKIELPNKDALYLKNPAPAYPAISKRLGEQGMVVLKVLIQSNGHATEVEIKKSSGYERLDNAAIEAAKKWLYQAGTINGQASTMWFNIPIRFILE